MTRPSDPSSRAIPSRAAAGWGRPVVLAALAATLSAVAAPGLAASPAAAPAGQGAPHGAAAPTSRDAAPARSTAAGQDADAGSRSVAARARMNECGHQWNNMKRAGTASGTWKEFSRNCLAQK